MYLVFGQRPFGTCDVVPELFYVQTWFFHIDYLPLIPLKSHLVLGKTGDQYQVVKMPFSFKSLLYTWGRVATFLLAAGTGVGAIVEASERVADMGTVATLATVSLASLALYLYLMIYPRKVKPSYDRACRLAVMAGLSDIGWAALNVQYGREVWERPPGVEIPQQP